MRNEALDFCRGGVEVFCMKEKEASLMYNSLSTR